MTPTRGGVVWEAKIVDFSLTDFKQEDAINECEFKHWKVLLQSCLVFNPSSSPSLFISSSIPNIEDCREVGGTSEL